jgi:hypothetical protein
MPVKGQCKINYFHFQSLVNKHNTRNRQSFEIYY